MTSSFDLVAKTIRARRTTKIFDGRPVDKSMIGELLELAVWAPNHRLNEPWRFRVLTQSGIAKLIASANPDTTFEKLKTAGAIVYVTYTRDDQPFIDQENYAATCAAIQNLMIGATAAGIQSYWGTGKISLNPKLLDFLKIPANEKFVGWIWLGYEDESVTKSSNAPARKRTPASEKTIWYD